MGAPASLVSFSQFIMLVRVEYGLITAGFLFEFELEGWGEVGLESGFLPGALSAVVTASATKALLLGGDGDLSFLTCVVKSVLLSLELLLKPVLSIATFLLFLILGLLLTPLLLVLHGLLMSTKFSLNIITADVAAISSCRFKNDLSLITFKSSNTQVFTITISSQQYHQFFRANFVIFNPDNFEINSILFWAFSVHLYDFFSISFADGTIHLMKSPQMCLEQCFLCRASGAEPLFMVKLSFYQDKSFSYQLFFSSKFCSIHTTFSSHHLQVLKGFRC